MKNPVRYKCYRACCERDARLVQLWSRTKKLSPPHRFASGALLCHRRVISRPRVGTLRNALSDLDERPYRGKSAVIWRA